MANNVYTKNYADGAALTAAKLDTAYQTLKPDLSNTTQLTSGGTAGTFLKCVVPGAAAQWVNPDDRMGIGSIRNVGLKCTAATGALVFTLTTGAGSTPSATDPVEIPFSSNGATTATQYSIQVTGTKTFTLLASASLGVAATTATNVFLYAIRTATTSTGVKLAVSSRSDFDNGTPVTTVSMTTSSDDISKLYATAAITSVARLLGVVTTTKNAGEEWQTPSAVNLNGNAHINIAASNIFTRTPVASAHVGEVAISPSSGTHSSASTSATAVTNLSVSLQTSGRPVRIELVPADGTNPSELIVTSAVSTNPSFSVFLYRDSTPIAKTVIGTQVQGAYGYASSITVPPGSVYTIDNASAGTFVYSVKTQLTAGSNSYVYHTKLVAYEL